MSELKSGIYVASRASIPERGKMWREARAQGAPIISSWIDEDGAGQSPSLSDLWQRITREVTGSARLVLYVEPDDFPLKGAFIEVGMALAAGVPIFVVAPGVVIEPRSCRPLGSWVKSPLVSFSDDIWVAFTARAPASLCSDCPPEGYPTDDALHPVPSQGVRAMEPLPEHALRAGAGVPQPERVQRAASLGEPDMTDRPILFSPDMVRALLAGTKTQTRRVLKPQPYPLEGRPGFWNASGVVGGRICVSDRDLLDLHRRPKAGDRLWVREAWRAELTWQPFKPSEIPDEAAIFYEADDSRRDNGLGAKFPGRKRPGMFMPRWASRLTLTVTEVRVQRVQEISEADARAEGCAAHGPGLCTENPDDYAGCYSAKTQFAALWNSLNAKRGFGWDANPWVAATTFTVERRNIDAEAA